jgi:hypothetical protein
MRIFINLILSFFIIFQAHAEDLTLDELAQYFAGFKGDTVHKEVMEELWRTYEDKNLNSLKEWQTEEIAPQVTSMDCTLFYPFSGPDIVHMVTLFPLCEKYIMVGLEPTGRISNLDLAKTNLAKVRAGIHSLLNRSFFVTREMWNDFSAESNGVLTPIITLLKRMNAELIAVESFYLNDKGEIIYQKTNTNGLKIVFKQHDNGYHQELYYIRKSLMGSSHGIDKLVDKEKSVITYLKAAQYALFDPRFSQIRSTIINKSNMILQDDSGIPYKYFNNKKWDIYYYGDYKGAYGKDFVGYNQPDLKRAYSMEKSKPLPFSLGYGYKKITTILLKMVKKTQAEKPSANQVILNKPVGPVEMVGPMPKDDLSQEETVKDIPEAAVKNAADKVIKESEKTSEEAKEPEAKVVVDSIDTKK